MPRIETRQAKSWIKCCCCQEQIRTFESFIQVVKDNGKPLGRERYCKGCEKYARLNNEITDVPEVDGEEHLRAMERFAGYAAEGCPSQFLEDEYPHG